MKRQSRAQSRGASPAIFNSTLQVKTSNGSRFPAIGSGQEDNNNSFGSDGSNSGGLIVGVCSEQGKRPYQEDEYAIRPHLGRVAGSQLSNVSQETHFFGLFDGHAGGKCSKYISSNLPEFFIEDPLYQSNIGLAIKRSFLTANEQFLKIAEKMKLHDGSTGICAIIRDGKLIVSNVGDCRCLIISGGKAIQMSVDQKPTSIEEQRRINLLGGTVLNCMGVARVNGVLAVSRAFGNRTLRAVIRPDAELTQRDLMKEDDYLIMASDGLWDVLRNKDVSDICYAASNFGCQHIAEELVHSALVKGSMDNVTCIVVKLAGYIVRLTKSELNGESASGKSSPYPPDFVAGAVGSENVKAQASQNIKNSQGHGKNDSNEQIVAVGNSASWSGNTSFVLTRPSTSNTTDGRKQMSSAAAVDDDDVTFVGFSKESSRYFDVKDQSAASNGNGGGVSKLLSSLNHQKFSSKLAPSNNLVNSLLFPNNSGGAGNGAAREANAIPVSPIASPIQSSSKRPVSMGGLRTTFQRAPSTNSNSIGMPTLNGNFRNSNAELFQSSNNINTPKNQANNPMAMFMDKVNGYAGYGGGSNAGNGTMAVSGASNLFSVSSNGYAGLRRPTPQRNS